MIFGAHVIVYSTDAAADRAFFSHVLGFPSVDVGHEWLIFSLPPAEMAVHPTAVDSGGSEGSGNSPEVGADLYLLCDDLMAEMAVLEAKGVRCSEVEEARWGLVTRIPLPGGGHVGLYQPRHPLALGTATS